MPTILITGGSSGIGLATAIKFLQAGYNTIVTGRNAAKLADVKTRYPGLHTWQSDTNRFADIRELFRNIQQQFSTLDALFVNAGSGIFKPFEEYTEADFDSQVNTNYKGLFFTVQQAIPLMAPQSSIILNASWTHLRGLKNAALYASSKAAVAYLGKALALELAEKHIRVNTVSPGYTNTEQFNEHQFPEAERRAMAGQLPMLRFGEAAETANVVYFLASADASYITGQEIVIDGGLTTAHQY